MAMPNPMPPSEPAHAAEARAEHRDAMRVVTNDTAPGTREEIARPVALLRDAPEEKEVMAWLEAVTSDLQMDPYDWSDDSETKPET